MSHSTRTILTQQYINSVNNAPNAFSVDRGGSSNVTPIVLVPSAPYCAPFSCWCCLQVPTGYWILQQKWDEDMGELLPGFKPIWPSWWKISHIVTKKVVTYNAPVKNCPTKDNVMVTIDVSLTFKIGPQLSNVKDFVYNLGATRFNHLLGAETDEGIRTLVHSVPVLKLHDLRDEFAIEMITGLNGALCKFGVTVLNAKITHVALPPGLDKVLQETTAYKAQMSNREKEHEARMQKLQDSMHINLLEKAKSYERKVADTMVEYEKALIAREKGIVEYNSRAKISVTNAETEAATLLTKAIANKAAAEVKGAEDLMKTRLQTHASCDEKVVIAEQALRSAKLEAEAILAVAASQAEEITANADAEKSAAANLKHARNFDLEICKAQSLAKIAGWSKLVIGGETGDRILHELVPVSK